MPTIQLASRTKQVTTYGRRNRNVVPVHSAGVGDDSFELIEPPAAHSPVKPKSKVGAKPSSTRAAPIYISDSSDLDNHIKSKRVTSKLKVNVNVAEKAKSKETRLIQNQYSASPRRVSKGARNVGLLRTPRKAAQGLSTPNRVPLSSKAYNTHMNPRRLSPLALKKPKLSKGKRASEILPPSSTTNKLMGAKPVDPTLRRVSRARGLQPSPPQRRAPQEISIIDLASDGEQVNVEKRIRNPKPVRTARAARMVLSSPSSSEEESDAGTRVHAVPASLREAKGTIPGSKVVEEDSYDEYQQSMPWNTAEGGRDIPLAPRLRPRILDSGLDFKSVQLTNDGGPSTSTSYLAVPAKVNTYPALPVVWKGGIRIQDTALHPVLARHIGGLAPPLSLNDSKSNRGIWVRLLPTSTLTLEGRIPPSDFTDYMARRVIEERAKGRDQGEMYGLLFTADGDDGGEAFEQFVDGQFLNGDVAVVFPYGNPPPRNSPGKKLYLVAIRPDDAVPEWLRQLGWDGALNDESNGEQTRTMVVVLGVLVLRKGAADTGLAIDSSPEYIGRSVHDLQAHAESSTFATSRVQTRQGAFADPFPPTASRGRVSTSQQLPPPRGQRKVVSSLVSGKSSIQGQNRELDASHATLPPVSVLPSAQKPISRVQHPPPPSLPETPPKPLSPYEAAVARVLSHVSSSVAATYHASADQNTDVKDPRILLPYASVADKRILNAWLERNYFIPRYPATTAVLNKGKGRARVDSFDSIATTEILDDISNTHNDKGGGLKRGVGIRKRVESFGSVASAEHEPDDSKHVALPTPKPSASAAGPSKPKPTAKHVYTPPPSLSAILAISGQASPYDFSDFIATVPFDEAIHGDDPTHLGASIRKAGEASFSEVFSVGDVVLKIIPIAVDGESAGLNVGGDVMWPTVSDARDVEKEIRATKLMGSVHPGFIKLLRTYVVRGVYPPTLLAEWNEFDERKGSENICPGVLPETQHYVIILLPNGGLNLESYEFTSSNKVNKNGWHQCASVFWQVCAALAVAEESVDFEHRDLHWGQILIDVVPLPVPKAKNRPSINSKSRKPVVFADLRPLLNHSMHGVKATIIDFGLSRMKLEDDMPQFTEFEEAIFEGTGEYQFDVYRMMRDHNRGRWNDFRPLTNVMWLHYLVLQLLDRFSLKRPAALKRPADRGKHPEYTERECWECLNEVEQLLEKAVAARTMVKSKKVKRPWTWNGGDFFAARDVIAWGRREEWIS